ncbi:alkylation response protein AidB-like acyl-CoA dehydrogenase [Kitasatospora sp. MAP12-15]|uniref:acyl-CoA dehydrogenase family protein n=1 Tax=unclassified Kitasatospora TaxID=2633591 RepID=UPI002474232B|nr:acyl-CoA dehydrogenase family protein [Kitasatospora sp. MAP12-44]MDH6109676.1 alkylation response protein AidB-like acyl-CoA dehydrogenase [Kitasatospora sp. MAP12-44]
MTADPNLLYSEIEEELRASVRDLLADHSPVSAVLARIEGSDGYDPALWRKLAADLGAAGLQVPESHGGAGASLRETAVVLEELGRSVAPVPFLGSAVLATTALLLAGDDAVRSLADGSRTGTLAVPFSTAPFSTAPGRPFTSSVTLGPGGTLSGRVTSVADARSADLLVVPAADGSLHLVETGYELTARTSLDLTRPLADLTFDRTPARPLTADPAVLAHTLLTGAGLLASEQLGIAEWCLTSTVGYLRERRQFNRPLGSFQALKHRLADLWLDVVGARAAARSAADALATASADAPVAVAVAASHCGTAAVRAAEECIQLHGGIGMTWEHPAHLYLKRAKADHLALGTPAHHRAVLAELVDLPA